MVVILFDLLSSMVDICDHWFADGGAISFIYRGRCTLVIWFWEVPDVDSFLCWDWLNCRSHGDDAVIFCWSIGTARMEAYFSSGKHDYKCCFCWNADRSLLMGCGFWQLRKEAGPIFYWCHVPVCTKLCKSISLLTFNMVLPNLFVILFLLGRC